MSRLFGWLGRGRETMESKDCGVTVLLKDRGVSEEALSKAAERRRRVPDG